MTKSRRSDLCLKWLRALDVPFTHHEHLQKIQDLLRQHNIPFVLDRWNMVYKMPTCSININVRYQWLTHRVGDGVVLQLYGNQFKDGKNRDIALKVLQQFRRQLPFAVENYYYINEHKYNF
jgi:hypothetical protein